MILSSHQTIEMIMGARMLVLNVRVDNTEDCKLGIKDSVGWAEDILMASANISLVAVQT